MNYTRKTFLVVGDGGCGKTSLLYTFVNGEFPRVDVSTSFNQIHATVNAKDQWVDLFLYDAGGSHDFDNVRKTCYPDTDVILVCFSVGQPTSLEKILSKWSPELYRYCRNVPVILVACQTDLREDDYMKKHFMERNQAIIPFEEGRRVAQQIKASAYMECSAKNNEGVKELFDQAVLISLKTRTCLVQSVSTCCIF